MKRRMRLNIAMALLILAIILVRQGKTEGNTDPSTSANVAESAVQDSPVSGVLKYAGVEIPWRTDETYTVINGNVPFFEENDFEQGVFEKYADLDGLGRCGAAFANIGVELMPEDKRGEIGSVKPSGWQSVKYDNVDGKYLYNRCQLIGFQLAGENANPKNLITGTRWLNVQGMLPFENMVADYVKETNDHVLYRVTPLFVGNELVARGVVMEAESAEDKGEDIQFCVFVYNIQPGISIDYRTGRSTEGENITFSDNAEVSTYIVNLKSGKFHIPECSAVSSISNKLERTATREEMLAAGYSP